MRNKQNLELFKVDADLTSLCRLTESEIKKSKIDREETIHHILSGCDSLTKRQYFTLYNAVCRCLHFVTCKKYNLPCRQNWFLHQLKDIIIDPNVEILYDQVISTDLAVGANWPDLVV